MEVQLTYHIWKFSSEEKLFYSRTWGERMLLVLSILTWKYFYNVCLLWILLQIRIMSCTVKVGSHKMPIESWKKLHPNVTNHVVFKQMNKLDGVSLINIILEPDCVFPLISYLCILYVGQPLLYVKVEYSLIIINHCKNWEKNGEDFAIRRHC